ncbi:MAG: 30S ribosome-binding factor RbfA [Thermogemmatispora sp.]|uniref:30S ribosome-binding factor RbfA n=1 Tax=Thermogemmatispora sp. TaxID=1968838 RepID=UPI001DF75F42|nr:30S ribosome-binding factor RbfA [Thermogemmatispora sp.]MBX5451077.1 30S ribosome-binding factor RbfA [Thermogemmatispora sp.]
MPNLYRQERLGELIAEELSDLLRTRMKDPRIGFVSITRVEVSGDLAHAKVYVSVLGSDEERNNTMAALKRATGFLRHELAGRLVLRHVPELVFKLDLSLEKGAEVMQLIKQIEQEHAQKQQQQQTSQASVSAQPATEEEQNQASDATEAE